MNKFLKNYMEFREKNNFKNLKEYEKSHISQEQFINVVKNNGLLIEHIDNPSEDVQLVAVKQNGNAIEFILDKGITPSEKVQLAAVTQNGTAISFILDYGITPSDDVQLAAVKKFSQAIMYIIYEGITPSEDVQLTAVQQNGNNIKFLIDYDIIPSEDVQLAAVNENKFSFFHIKEPYPSVIKLYKELTNK